MQESRERMVDEVKNFDSEEKDAIPGLICVGRHPKLDVCGVSGFGVRDSFYHRQFNIDALKST